MVPQPRDDDDSALQCVLVVDDDAVLRFLLAEALREAGFAVIEARSGSDALSCLTAGSRVDIIISDVQMPGPIDGTALARRVRAEYPAIPVVLTSGHGIPAAQSAAEEFIPKPYELEHVLRVIRRILGAKGCATP